MAVQEFGRNVHGSSVRWFGLAAAVMAFASLAGARALDWLSQPGRLSVVAFMAPPQRSAAAKPDVDIDRMPTGSIGRNAVLIRLP
jgi:hypothetical protein